MGFSLKGWASHALKIPKSIKKINVGKSIRRSVTSAISGFEAGIKGAGGSAGGVGQELVQTGNAVQGINQYLPWLIGGVAVVALLLFMRKR